MIQYRPFLQAPHEEYYTEEHVHYRSTDFMNIVIHQ